MIWGARLLVLAAAVRALVPTGRSTAAAILDKQKRDSDSLSEILIERVAEDGVLSLMVGLLVLGALVLLALLLLGCLLLIRMAEKRSVKYQPLRSEEPEAGASGRHKSPGHSQTFTYVDLSNVECSCQERPNGHFGAAHQARFAVQFQASRTLNASQTDLRKPSPAPRRARPKGQGLPSADSFSESPEPLRRSRSGERSAETIFSPVNQGPQRKRLRTEGHITDESPSKSPTGCLSQTLRERTAQLRSYNPMLEVELRDMSATKIFSADVEGTRPESFVSSHMTPPPVVTTGTELQVRSHSPRILDERIPATSREGTPLTGPTPPEQCEKDEEYSLNKAYGPDDLEAPAVDMGKENSYFRQYRTISVDEGLAGFESSYEKELQEGVGRSGPEQNRDKYPPLRFTVSGQQSSTIMSDAATTVSRSSAETHIDTTDLSTRAAVKQVKGNLKGNAASHLPHRSTVPAPVDTTRRSSSTMSSTSARLRQLFEDEAAKARAAARVTPHRRPSPTRGTSTTRNGRRSPAELHPAELKTSESRELSVPVPERIAYFDRSREPTEPMRSRTADRNRQLDNRAMPKASESTTSSTASGRWEDKRSASLTGTDSLARSPSGPTRMPTSPTRKRSPIPAPTHQATSAKKENGGLEELVLILATPVSGSPKKRTDDHSSTEPFSVDGVPHKQESASEDSSGTDISLEFAQPVRDMIPAPQFAEDMQAATKNPSASSPSMTPGPYPSKFAAPIKQPDIAEETTIPCECAAIEDMALMETTTSDQVNSESTETPEGYDSSVPETALTSNEMSISEGGVWTFSQQETAYIESPALGERLATTKLHDSIPLTKCESPLTGKRSSVFSPVTVSSSMPVSPSEFPEVGRPGSAESLLRSSKKVASESKGISLGSLKGEGLSPKEPLDVLIKTPEKSDVIYTSLEDIPLRQDASPPYAIDQWTPYFQKQSQKRLATHVLDKIITSENHVDMYSTESEEKNGQTRQSALPQLEKRKRNVSLEADIERPSITYVPQGTETAKNGSTMSDKQDDTWNEMKQQLQERFSKDARSPSMFYMPSLERKSTPTSRKETEPLTSPKAAELTRRRRSADESTLSGIRSAPKTNSEIKRNWFPKLGNNILDADSKASKRKRASDSWTLPKPEFNSALQQSSPFSQDSKSENNVVPHSEGYSGFEQSMDKAILKNVNLESTEEHQASRPLEGAREFSSVTEPDVTANEATPIHRVGRQAMLRSVTSPSMSLVDIDLPPEQAQEAPGTSSPKEGLSSGSPADLSSNPLELASSPSSGSILDKSTPHDSAMSLDIIRPSSKSVYGVFVTSPRTDHSGSRQDSRSGEDSLLGPQGTPVHGTIIERTESPDIFFDINSPVSAQGSEDLINFRSEPLQSPSGSSSEAQIKRDHHLPDPHSDSAREEAKKKSSST